MFRSAKTKSKDVWVFDWYISNPSSHFVDLIFVLRPCSSLRPVHALPSSSLPCQHVPSMWRASFFVHLFRFFSLSTMFFACVPKRCFRFACFLPSVARFPCLLCLSVRPTSIFSWNWVGSVLQFLQSPRWIVPISTFLDKHCAIFDDEEENKLPYTGIHHLYRGTLLNMTTNHVQGLDGHQYAILPSCQPAKDQAS